MHAKFIFVARAASTEGALAIILPPGVWHLALVGGGRGSLGLRWSWGYSQTVPWPKVDLGQSSSTPCPKSTTAFEVCDRGPEGPVQSH